MTQQTKDPLTADATATPATDATATPATDATATPAADATATPATDGTTTWTADDRQFVRRAAELAREAEAGGNLPVGACIVLDGAIIAEGRNAVLVPHFAPGAHAEQVALAAVEPALWPRARDMTIYTSLEPCTMCFGAVLLHGIGRIVYGASDVRGGARFLLHHLPPYYEDGRGVPAFIGPVLPAECDELYRRCDARFSELPCGVSRQVDGPDAARGKDDTEQ